MQKLKKYFKLLLVLSMFLSLPLFAKKALMPIVMDDIVVMVSYTIPKPPKPVPFPYKGRVKKTGQIKSYDYYGNVVTDGSFKDDGYYQTGVTPSYSRANEVVTDNVTGLEWQDNIEAKTITKNWADAQTYCSSLSLDGGRWRLPSIDELMYIADRSKANPAIDTGYFVNVVSNAYWSSTTVVGYESHAWYVYFNYGSGYWYNKSSSFYVRCVRDGQ